MGLQSGEGISSHMDCLVHNEDKDECNPRFSPCRAQAKFLLAGGTVHGRIIQMKRETVKNVAHSNGVA